MKLNWYHYLELLFPLYLFFVIVYGMITDNLIFGYSGFQYLTWFFFVFGLAIVFWIIFYFMVGADDYRFQIITHILFLGAAASMSGIQASAIDLPNFFSSDSKGEILFQLMWVLIFTAVPSFGVIAALINLPNPFKDEMNSLANNLKTGTEIKEIRNVSLYKDAYFGSTLVFLFETVKTFQKAYYNVKEVSDHMALGAEELASNAEELHATVEDISSVTHSMAEGASKQAEELANVVNQLSETDVVLNEIIGQIQNNVKVLSQIAIQTNILALNAGIEASRAGDYGRGFAVVADNVRKLSEESSSSADQISKIVAEISDRLKTLFLQLQKRIENVAAISEETASSSEEVSASINEMGAHIQQINTLSQELAQLSEKNLELFVTPRLI